MVGLGQLENALANALLRRDEGSRACNCIVGPNCCIKVAEREREATIRADERRKVLEELRGETQLFGPE